MIYIQLVVIDQLKFGHWMKWLTLKHCRIHSIKRPIKQKTNFKFPLFRYGHQSAITSIDALARERAITSGGSDCSIRIWKIVEESQLVYNGHRGNIETVKLINEENFLSSGDDG